MAAAAVASVARILEQTLEHQHLILHNREEIEFLLKEVSFLQHSLDDSSKKKREIVESFESQVIVAAYKARDLIESHIREQLIRESRYIFSSRWLNEVRREIDFIDEQVKRVKEDSVVKDLQPMILPPGDVVFDDDFIEIMYRLVSESYDKLKTVSIVGMAGIGKTTIANEVYSGSITTLHHFDIRAWITVSQTYRVRQIIIELLDTIKRLTNEMHKESTEQLGEYLYKSLNSKGLEVFDCSRRRMGY